MDEWFNQIESKVFSQLEYMLKSRTDAPFPDLKCTTVNQITKPSEFPTMYIHELQPVEAGHDLDNVSVNAILHTMEIQVWTDKGQSDCKNIMAKAVTEMKRLRYNIIMFPVVTTDSEIAQGVFRARRMIGKGDTL